MVTSVREREESAPLLADADEQPQVERARADSSAPRSSASSGPSDVRARDPALKLMRWHHWFFEPQFYLVCLVVASYKGVASTYTAPVLIQNPPVLLRILNILLRCVTPSPKFKSL